MMSDWLTKPKRCVSSALLTLFLSGCQSPPPVEPPPPVSKLAEAGVPTEALKSLCLAWFNSQPTWGDADTERTKNEIDYSYRVHEAVCAPYLAR